jgi:hypothetical protein
MEETSAGARHEGGDGGGEQGGGKEKGKDVARNESGQDQGPESSRLPDGESIMSRVGRSAASLSQSVLHGTPRASDVAELSSSGKAGPSSSSSRPALGETSFPASTAGSSGNTWGFRSADADAHAAAGEAAFSDFLDGTPVFVATEPVGLDQAWQQASGVAPGVPGAQAASRRDGGYAVAEQQAQDGVEVVRLLSQVTEEAPNLEQGTTISEGEMRSLRQALFEEGGPGQISATDWNNILNFVPDFLLGRSDSTVLGAHENSHMNLGVTEPAEAGQIWLEQWNRVLTGYMDEVWGDLGSLVEEARTEVTRMKDTKDEQTTSAPALRQLRSILSRVRARL